MSKSELPVGASYVEIWEHSLREFRSICVVDSDIMTEISNLENKTIGCFCTAEMQRARLCHATVLRDIFIEYFQKPHQD